MSKISRPRPVLLTPREAAALIGITPATLALWMREGRHLPSDACVFLPGGHRRYRQDAIHAFRDSMQAGGRVTS